MSAHAAESESIDCLICHKRMSLTDWHLSAGETRVEFCTQCHQNTGDDPYFLGINIKHQKLGLLSGSCHSEQGAEEMDTKLKEIFNK